MFMQQSTLQEFQNEHATINRMATPKEHTTINNSMAKQRMKQTTLQQPQNKHTSINIMQTN